MVWSAALAGTFPGDTVAPITGIGTGGQNIAVTNHADSFDELVLRENGWTPTINSSPWRGRRTPPRCLPPCPCAKGWQWRRAEFLHGRATRLSVPSRWYSRSPLHLKAAHRVPGWSRLVRCRLRYRPEELCTFFHRECRFAASHAAAETAEAPVGFLSSFCHRPIRYRDRKTLVAAAPL